ncbi:hypothetical protein ACJRO7_002713 [Eucalyptus globulus]|uniref:HMA domain-containing protein n=1 Tax=Eucalyptus globulus TaxID=34317 RepID=A0ABD3LVB0_EUCGL
MQKAVLKLDVHDNKDKRKAMKIVSGFAGVDSIDINLKDQKLTVAGAVDPVELVGKLRKVFITEIVSVGPAKDAQKKDGDKKEGDKGGKDSAKVAPLPYVYYQPPPPHPYYYPNYIAEEGPNSCVIC